MKHKLSIVILLSLMFLLMAFINIKPKEAVELGNYSISLNVKNISNSYSFYNKLGFEPIKGMGSINNKWMILTNGKTKIGLFQGMFPSNTLTFNPKDGRSIYKKLKNQGINPTFETGMDTKEGPCSFSITDPDGNPILIDQH